MKVMELLEAGGERQKWRHHGSRGYGLRVGVTKEQRDEVVRRIGQLLAKDAAAASHQAIIWTSPERGSTFPADIRLVISREDERSDRSTLVAQVQPSLLKSVIRKVFKEVLGIDVEVTIDSDYDANRMRYIDTSVRFK